MDGTVTGTLDTPTAAATLHGIDLAISGEPLGMLEMHAALRGRRVEVDSTDARQAAAGRQWPAHGDWQLRPRHSRLHVRRPVVEREARQRRLPDGRKVAGNVALEGNGAGTVEVPAGALE
jgi:hypothetical protein